MKKISLLLLICFNFFLAAAFVFAQTHPCNCVYLAVLNQSSSDLKVIIKEEDYGVLWAGEVPNLQKPLYIKAAATSGDISYIVNLEENGQEIYSSTFGYDEPGLGYQNFFIITHDKKVQYYTWPSLEGDMGSFLSGVIFAFGYFISCPLQKIGLSPRSIPAYE